MQRSALFSNASASLGNATPPARPVIDLASGQIASLDLRDIPGAAAFPCAAARSHELIRQAGHVLPGHVGLSLATGNSSLDDPAFSGRMLHALKSLGVAPGRVTLYFQDQQCLERGMAALDALLLLKRRGFQLGLDITNLDMMPSLFVERLPVDILRLDPLDIMDVAVNPETASLASDFVAYADNLLMRTAARGVRHENQLATLKRLGFTFGQGPYFAMPSLPEALPAPSPSARKDAAGRGRPS